LSAARIYDLMPAQSQANRRKISRLEETVVRDLLHRLARRTAIPWGLLGDVVRLSPGLLVKAPWYVVRVFAGKLQGLGSREHG